MFANSRSRTCTLLVDQNYNEDIVILVYLAVKTFVTRRLQ